VLTEQDVPEGFAEVEVLSPTGDLVAAAAGFFQALHRLDAAGLDGIAAVRFPEQGLGRALNDRLQRAAFREPGPTVSER
jgi:L-threonylcarbamoyladenylate synthase